MHIWVDADSCPRAAKDILFRAADRVRVPLTLVANKPLWTPTSPFIDTIVVGAGQDVADHEIARRVTPGDLVITADIPLVSDVIARGGFALNPRGVFYTEANARQSLTMRNFADTLRGTGISTGGPPAFSQKDRMAFANELDRFLTRHVRQVP